MKISKVFSLFCITFGLATVLIEATDKEYLRFLTAHSPSFVSSYAPMGVHISIAVFCIPLFLILSGFYFIRNKSFGADMFYAYCAMIAWGMLWDFFLKTGFRMLIFNSNLMLAAHCGFALFGVFYLYFSKQKQQ